jgi:RNA polymerase sigma-70 factor, ECF subfamily
MEPAFGNEASSIGSRADELARLVDAMRRGDERALEQLYDATVGKLYALASSILNSVEDAEEVVCATYAHAWSHASSYSVERGPVLGWLLMLCRSRALDRLRQLRAARAAIDVATLHDKHSDDAPQPEDLLLLLQEHSRVRAALAKLPPERRDLISLAFLSGMSHQEIAATTGLPLGTVKSHVRRALVQLRDELESS